MNTWWSELPDERFWIEITDRDVVGQDLRATEPSPGEVDPWGRALVDEVRPGDVVFHYRKQESAITGRSVVASRAAHRIALLSDHQALRTPLSLDAIRAEADFLKATKDALESQVDGPLYFPFEVSDSRPPRPAQTYIGNCPRHS